MKDRDKVGNETMTINILNTQQSMLKATLVSDQTIETEIKQAIRLNNVVRRLDFIKGN